MQKIILAVLILCSAHFGAMAEGNVDSTLIKDNADTVLIDDKRDGEVKLLDWGILLDISYGFDVLTDGGGLGLSYFDGHHLLSFRYTESRIRAMAPSPFYSLSTNTYIDSGLLYGYLFSNGMLSGSMSCGIGVVWSDGRGGGGLVAGLPFELNGLVQIDRYFAVGVKAYGSISSDSFVGAVFTLRLGAVTQ